MDTATDYFFLKYIKGSITGLNVKNKYELTYLFSSDSTRFYHQTYSILKSRDTPCFGIQIIKKSSLGCTLNLRRENKASINALVMPVQKCTNNLFYLHINIFN